jgi:oligopeptide transport system substrate-binding protein
MLRRNFQTSLATWTTDYLDPWDYLENYRTDAVGMNWTHYSSRTYDDLLDRSRVAPDTAARLRLMEQAEAQLLDDQPIIPLQFRVIQWLVNPHLAGWNVTPINIHLSRELSWSP